MATRGKRNVYTIHDAEVILSFYDVNWIRRVKQVVSRLAYGSPEYGIHIYYQDKEGNDLAYYTEITQSLMIFEEPRQSGDHIEYVEF